MVRAFQTHRIRASRELSGTWDFALVKGVSDRIPSVFPYRMTVPGCWESHPELVTYRGRGAYRSSFDVSGPGAIRLEFKGVSHTADVFVDGKRVGHHYNAYTPFSFTMPRVGRGKHELVVFADNSFSPQSVLHRANDYYSYGGISRPVVVEEIADTYIEWVHFTPKRSGSSWTADIDVSVRNIGRTEQAVTISSTLAERSVAFGTARVAPGGSRVLSRTAVSFGRVEEWSHEHPALYLLETTLCRAGQAVPVDDLIERVGFRTVEVKGRRLVVNGHPVFLKGFNRHEDDPHTGCALPAQLMARDLHLVEHMNGNAIRTCHYPNDELFLDFCDERGIYVWEENHARGLKLDEMLKPEFTIQCGDCNREMVQNHFNHPSIIIWAILNECASNTREGRAMYRAQLRQIRSMDESRPLTFATCHHHTDLCLDLGDLVSLNSYSRWYADRPVGPSYLKSKGWVDRSGGKGKPVIISEFGAGALYGFREPTRVKSSEERQMDILDEALRYYPTRPEIIGLFIWQFADCRVSDDNGWSLRRPRAKNDKGVVDEYRRPKLSYEVVRKLYGAIAR